MPVRSGDESQTSIVNGGGKAGKRRQTSHAEIKDAIRWHDAIEICAMLKPRQRRPWAQQPQNPVSTLNNPTGTYVANAAIVPAGSGGSITAFGSDDTHLAVDINGYFASAGTG